MGAVTFQPCSSIIFAPTGIWASFVVVGADIGADVGADVAVLMLRGHLLIDLYRRYIKSPLEDSRRHWPQKGREPERLNT